MPQPLPILELPATEGRHFHQPLRAAPTITTLQINIGLRCNLACRHCHVDSSPARSGDHENMSSHTADRVLKWLASEPGITTIDLTGGSPEMNAQFPRLVREARAMGKQVIDRCNPTIIHHTPGSLPGSAPGNPTPGQDYTWVPQFLADHQVQVVASMPCYLEDNVEKQRGKGAYNASAQGLLALNKVGYGRDPELKLNLVYNPGGPSLPPPQDALAEDYHRELKERFGIVFNELWTITNMPIARWRHDLERQGKLDVYMDKLIEAYNPDTIDDLMCRHQIHIDSQGRLHDCDFNYALGLPMTGHEAKHLWDFTADDLADRAIATADHCYGCTAGAGSSCGGSLL